jgi:hypothetical protein
MPQTNTAFGAYSISHRGFTLTPAHNFAKKATVVTLSKKLSSGQTVKGSYSLKDQAAMLELGVAPLTVLSLFFLACLYFSPFFCTPASIGRDCSSSVALPCPACMRLNKAYRHIYL